MAIIKCKMCGGDLNIAENNSVAVCEYCGAQQTVPSADNEKKLTLFGRANRLRMACEFDKAAGVYESIVADFPEEAEAYWGLVLCKYGIEYVDDPATGKKIPTCHRSSFDSVMDDSNLDQALENADAIARRVYRDEAKAIEELRKGIIEVSGNEDPYDIFICYKETDDSGDRTIDSVIAQEVYDALTEKGYRVFFSRITLEDKLGQEYEPYIFAALHSAKIMLAFGTDYEYYNAVWVKNEWSRFLQLIAAGEKKTLIPCYKNIDAYDMPKEFARLQAQDMGKVGAMQDLLRGIEKILPREKQVVKETVVVQQSAEATKVQALLDRGNMALEDGEWAKADGFFEEVLNNDAKCAWAYVGKTLAQERCKSLEAFVEKRIAIGSEVEKEEETIPLDEDHIQEMVDKYAIMYYLDAREIKRLYDFDSSYKTSSAAAYQRMLSEEESYWSNHKLLFRAEKFGAAELSAAKEKVFSVMADRISQAEKEKEVVRQELQERYAAHIAEVDDKVAQMYIKAEKSREIFYQEWAERARTGEDVSSVEGAKHALLMLNGYKDSQDLIELCDQRIKEIEAEQQMEALYDAYQEIFSNKNLDTMRNWKEVKERFDSLEGYKDSAELAEKCLENIVRLRNSFDAVSQRKKSANRIVAKGYHTVGVSSDGTVVTAGDNRSGQCNVSNWHDIVSVAAGPNHTVGLRSDGTVVAVGDNTQGQCEVGTWTDIVAIAAGSVHTVGLYVDGTVVTAGENHSGQCFVSSWRNIVAIDAGPQSTIGLRSDGTVVSAGTLADDHSVADLKNDIIAIAAGNFHTVGLHTDGTVTALGWNKNGQCDVSGWRNIVAIAAGTQYTIGLHTDGTVVCSGEKTSSHNVSVSKWNNIVAIATGSQHTIGLKADGTVVAAGTDSYGCCSVSGWQLYSPAEITEFKRTILNRERGALQAELPSLKGLFSGGRRKQVEARLAEIDRELARLG